MAQNLGLAAAAALWLRPPSIDLSEDLYQSKALLLKGWGRDVVHALWMLISWGLLRYSQLAAVCLLGAAVSSGMLCTGRMHLSPLHSGENVSFMAAAPCF